MTSTETTSTETTADETTAAEVAAPNVAADVPADIAEGAGPEQHETEHADPATTASGSDDRREDTGRAHQLAWLDPAILAVHPRNVRDDLGDLSGLAASIAAQGVLEALTVVPHTNEDGSSGYQLVAGHRRAAAAILAWVPAVPCVLRPDLAAAEDDRAGQARHVGAMLAENLHRQGLSAVEEARGVQTMIELGDSVAKVARSTGLARKRVAKAAGVARLDADTAAAVTAAGLTLDQAAAVAVYAEDAETTAGLIAAAEQGPGQFAHALTRAKQEREEAEKVAALTAELTAAGRTLIEAGEGSRHTRIAQLVDDGQPLTAEAHTSCPGSAVYVTSGWNGPQVVEVCADPASFGHADRYGRAALPGGEPTEADRAAQQQALADERRTTIANNKQMAAANETRREWLRGFLLRKSAPKAALRFAVESMATNPRALSRWLSGQSNSAQGAASAALGITAPGLWSTTTSELTLTSGEQVADGRLPVVLLAHVAGAIESGMHRGTWRNPTASDARWLRFLTGCGYTLADIEQQIVDAIDQRATRDDLTPEDGVAGGADDGGGSVDGPAAP